MKLDVVLCKLQQFTDDVNRVLLLYGFEIACSFRLTNFEPDEIIPFVLY